MSELSDQDVEAIEEVHNRWISEELAANSSQVFELCTDDVKWIPPNAPPLVGKDAVAQYLSDSAVELKDVHVKEVMIRGSGSVAYLTSGYHSRFVGEGETEELRAEILKLVADAKAGSNVVTFPRPQIQSPNRNNLSKGTKIAIGVAIAVAVVAVILVSTRCDNEPGAAEHGLGP